MVLGLWAIWWLISSNNISKLIKILGTKYFFGIIEFLIFLISLCFIFSILHGTFDISYAGLLFAQLIHMIFGSAIICVLYIKYKLTIKQILVIIIFCYIIQSFIELAASAIPPLASFMKYFTGDDLQDRYNGVRGLALTSAAGWSLGLTFGIVFIIYCSQVLLKKTDIRSIGGLLILVLGCFFAGRTGLFGLIIGIAYYILFGKFSHTISLLFKIIITVLLGIEAVFLIFPEYYEFAADYILPFALEPLYNFMDGKGFSSRSTDRLGEMWQVTINDWDLLIGTGVFTNPDGSYCQFTDVGVLRNILYWGIAGYIFIILYQIYITLPALKHREYRKMMVWILLYLAICECKAVTIGLNKMTFSILFLIGSITFLNSNREKYEEGHSKENINYSSNL